MPDELEMTFETLTRGWASQAFSPSTLRQLAVPETATCHWQEDLSTKTSVHDSKGPLTLTKAQQSALPLFAAGLTSQPPLPQCSMHLLLSPCIT